MGMDPLSLARNIWLGAPARQGLTQNRARLLLHRAAVARRLETQLRLGGLIEIANRKRCMQR